MSYERTQEALWQLHGVKISQGGIDKIMRRAGKKAIKAIPAIEKSVRESAVIHSDETGNRVNGDNWWEWVFWTTQAVLHVILFNRGDDVIKDVLDQIKPEVWVSDCYAAQLKTPGQHIQLCMSHQLRNLQAVVDAHPTLTWARAMPVLFRYAIHLHHQREHLSPVQFAFQVERIERHCDRLLARTLDPPGARRIQKRYRKHRDKLCFYTGKVLNRLTTWRNEPCDIRSSIAKSWAVSVPNGETRLLLPWHRSLIRLNCLASILLLPFNLFLVLLHCRFWQGGE